MKKKYYKNEIPDKFKDRVKFIGLLLKEYRWDLGLTRKNIEQDYKIPASTIQFIENGGNISLINLFRYIECLEIDLNEVFFDDFDNEIST